MGTINLHGSLLPQYRGAAPINWAVINGEKETGVTTFKLQHAIDTGDILLQAHLPIGENDTAGEIHDRMKDLGAALLVKTMEGLAAGSITEIAQAPDASSKHAPKLFTETCQINWQHTSASIHNLIRGLSPYPGAFTSLHQKTCKIFSSRKEMTPHQLAPGTVESDGKTFLRFAAADGFIQVLELQLEGKKRMPVQDFLRGYRMEA
jgi:methionyl-tRNA formyltransferase